jgi:hypothetical protein
MLSFFVCLTFCFDHFAVETNGHITDHALARRPDPATCRGKAASRGWWQHTDMA